MILPLSCHPARLALSLRGGRCSSRPSLSATWLPGAKSVELAARFGATLRDATGESGEGAESPGATSNLNLGWRPRYNIAPGQHNPVVVRDASGHNQLELMQWGLVPAWSRGPKVAY